MDGQQFFPALRPSVRDPAEPNFRERRQFARAEPRHVHTQEIRLQLQVAAADD